RRRRDRGRKESGRAGSERSSRSLLREKQSPSREAGTSLERKMRLVLTHEAHSFRLSYDQALSPECITRKVFPPLLHTSTRASCPFSILDKASLTSAADLTGFLFTSWMTSPDVRPALSAGLPGCTRATTAPCTSLGAWSCCR